MHEDGTASKRTVGLLARLAIGCCALSLSLGLVACGATKPVADDSAKEPAPAQQQQGESTGTQESKPSNEKPQSESQTESTSTPSETSAQGTPQISMGELSMIDTHDTDSGANADVVIEVINTSDVPLVLGSGTIRIADANGNVLVDESGNGIFTGPSFLRPGDIGFVYTSGPLTLPDGYSAGSDYLAQGTAELTACKEVYEYPIKNQSISEDAQHLPMVTGTVTNDDTEKAKYIEITAMFTDNEGHMLGVASDSVANLEPGASKDFTIEGIGLPVGCTMDVISDFDVIAVAPKR
ncbi:MAG: FxLYD domain-containing protein [Coriobacteriales bacterium]|nr:FxLYD domain-containing protein [Coriobacteriales bacterium]